MKIIKVLGAVIAALLVLVLGSVVTVASATAATPGNSAEFSPAIGSQALCAPAARNT